MALGRTNTPPDLLPGTLDLLILRTLADRAEARLRHRRAAAPGVGGRAAGRRELALPRPAAPAAERLGKAEWGASENNRRARYYTLTAAGRKRLGAEREEFERLVVAIQRVLQTG